MPQSDLLADDLRYRAGDQRLEGGVVDMAVLRARLHRVEQLVGAREAAHMRGEDPVVAALHVSGLLQCRVPSIAETMRSIALR